jgi:hypothetical protein
LKGCLGVEPRRDGIALDEDLRDLEEIKTFEIMGMRAVPLLNYTKEFCHKTERKHGKLQSGQPTSVRH